MNIKQLVRDCIFATGATALVFFAMNVQAADYATPVCKASSGQCFQYNPVQPNTAKGTIVTAQIYSGFPWEARAPNPSIEIDGSVIRVTGTFVHCTGCIDSTVPPPVPYTFALPLLPAGSYSLELRLKPDPSYVPPPAVDTGNGLVVAGIFMSSTFTVTSGTLGALEQVIEYFDPIHNHYFMTPLSNEIDLLDARQPPFENWVRTGFAFNAYAADTAPQASAPICRFFNDSFGNGNGSHFYAAQGLGCEETMQYFPDWMLETPALFNETVPSPLGACAADMIPVYRLYNNGMGGSPNHRFLTDIDERQRMIGLGWIPEGFGVGVAMCAPK